MHLPHNLPIFKSLLTRIFLPLKSRKCATPLNIKQPYPAAHPNNIINLALGIQVDNSNEF